MCPPTPKYPRAFIGDEGLSCDFPEALKVIEEKCHGQELCSLITAPEVFLDHRRQGEKAASKRPQDPCPGYRKYVETAFKCKPDQFRSRVVCQGDPLHLSCDNEEEDRLAIYSASFSSAEGSHIFCPALQRGPPSSHLTSALTKDLDKCEASHVTKAVMQMCHGQSKSAIYFVISSTLGPLIRLRTWGHGIKSLQESR